MLVDQQVVPVLHNSLLHRHTYHTRDEGISGVQLRAGLIAGALMAEVLTLSSQSEHDLRLQCLRNGNRSEVSQVLNVSYIVPGG